MSYQLATYGVIRLSDSLLITKDMAEWQVYREWIRTGGIPTPMAAPAGPTVAEVLLEVKALITAKRDAVQYGGATVGGMTIKTDPSSLALLGQVLQFSGLRPQRVFKVKNAEAVHVDMMAAQIGGLFEALIERVALCWDNEAAHFATADGIAYSFGVSDETKIANLRALDYSTGWPA